MYAIALYNTFAPRIIALLLGIIGISAFLYGALLLGAVMHTAARTSAQRQVRSISVAVSSLESTFLAQTKELSPERAALLGFVQPQTVSTVYAGTGALTLGGTPSGALR